MTSTGSARSGYQCGDQAEFQAMIPASSVDGQPLSPLHRRMLIVTRGMTFNEIAMRTAHHPETVRRYFRGQDPSIRFVQRLCQEYGADANWMLLGYDEAQTALSRSERPMAMTPIFCRRPA